MADIIPPYPIDVDDNSYERIDWFTRTAYAINNQPTVVGSNVSYWQVASAAAVKKPVTGPYVPATVTFSGFSATGTNPPVPYAGRFVVAKTTDGTTFTDEYVSTVNESSYVYTIPAGIVGFRSKFYYAGGLSLVDEVFIPIVEDGTDGAGSSKYFSAQAFQWSNSGCPAHSQAFVFTWAGFTASAYPTGWTSTAPASPGTGYTLWCIILPITDVQSAVTTAANWNVASENVFGYRQDGTIGPTGSPGGPGEPGDSARMMYAKAPSSTTFTPGSTVATVGPSSFPNTGFPFGVTGLTWQQTPPTFIANESLFQSDGVFDYSANITVWQTPYLSNLKVGELSAIVANLGFVNVASGGALYSGKSNATDVSTAGFFLGNDGGVPKFSIGYDANTLMTWNGSSLSIKGGSVSVGNAGLGTSSIVSGSGAGFAPAGGFYAGNSTSSIFWNATTGILTINGQIVSSGNINASSLSAITSNLGSVDIASGGYVKSGKTSFSDTASGFYLGNDGGTPKLAIGTDANKLVSWDGSALLVKGARIEVGDAVPGTSSITSGTGAGFAVGGGLWAGNTTNSILWNATTGILTVNGTIVQTNNIVVGAVGDAYTLPISQTMTVTGNDRVTGASYDAGFAGSYGLSCPTGQTLTVHASGYLQSTLRSSGFSAANQVVTYHVELYVKDTGGNTSLLSQYIRKERTYIEVSDINNHPFIFSGTYKVPGAKTINDVGIRVIELHYNTSQANGYTYIACMSTVSVLGNIHVSISKV
jgi:hypothetical protein